MMRLGLMCTTLLVSLAACGTAPRPARFCDQLRDIIVAGADDFRSVTGSRLDRRTAAAEISLQGAKRCEIDGLAGRTPIYKCYFSEALLTRLDGLKAEMLALEKRVDACLVDQDWPRLNLAGKSDPGRRYENRGLLEVSGTKEQWVWYADRQRRGQDVRLRLSRKLGRAGYVNLIEIHSQ